ncbi:MAG: hypothetical protein WAV60_04675, partial [Anaerolineae bacterium]
SWVGFNRPKAISCLATLGIKFVTDADVDGFNRPKAISCLATVSSWLLLHANHAVSIAHYKQD